MLVIDGQGGGGAGPDRGSERLARVLCVGTNAMARVHAALGRKQPWGKRGVRTPKTPTSSWAVASLRDALMGDHPAMAAPGPPGPEDPAARPNCRVQIAGTGALSMQQAVADAVEKFLQWSGETI